MLILYTVCWYDLYAVLAPILEAEIVHGLHPLILRNCFFMTSLLLCNGVTLIAAGTSGSYSNHRKPEYLTLLILCGNAVKQFNCFLKVVS